MGLKINWF